ncbi:hypothetical protein AAKU64_001608 [Undibacterium sp. GrIS 1.8]|uniref:hypothetical protein n=1 Tax=unclassified Undibacterium TaxID=2630295 RepID=UPI0033932146
MGLLILLFLAVIYVLLVSLLISYIKPWWLRPFVAIIFIAIPTADAVYGRYRLHQMCNAESGLKIYRVVDNVPGFYSAFISPNEEWLKNYGYRYIEGSGPGGQLTRLTLQENGSISEEIGGESISKYAYGFKHGNITDIYYRVEQIIYVKATNEILSRVVNISFTGGWVERLLAGLYGETGSAENCGQDVGIEMVPQTLKPIKPTK